MNLIVMKYKLALSRNADQVGATADHRNASNPL